MPGSSSTRLAGRSVRHRQCIDLFRVMILRDVVVVISITGASAVTVTDSCRVALICVRSRGILGAEYRQGISAAIV